MAIAGKVAITPKGEWNAETAYTKLDFVFYDNASYVAIQPSTGVEPTNTSYWMLVVQSAGGADLEGIINGDIQVGNAKTLDGHEAEYFFPKSGGDVEYLNIARTTANDTSFFIKNTVRSILERVYADGLYQMYDFTNKKTIIKSTADGTTTFNGTASGNLPLKNNTLQTVETANKYGLGIKNTVADALEAYFAFSASKTLGFFGFNAENAPVFRDSSGVNHALFHTGNKPTGTYTGDGTSYRTIKTGGTGNAIAIKSEKGMAICVGGFCVTVKLDASVVGTVNVSFANGELLIKTSSDAINASGVTYTYEVL